MNMHPCTTPEAIAEAARAAETAGFESLWGGEHIVLSDPQAPPSPLPPLRNSSICARRWRSSRRTPSACV
jgi:alkanesulfonate monooxygenase SsuD/methylene tetrahydromethanopterin reductase-like flavin-dependent oxidoreductase (luciferase family)